MHSTPRPAAGAARRSWILHMVLAAGMVAGLLVVVPAVSGAAPDAAVNPLDPESGVLVGMYSKPKDGDWTEAGIKRRWATLEKAAGRTLDVGHYYYKINESFPTWRERWHRDMGRIPVVSWASVSTSKIINGTYDAQIRARADDVKAFGSPILIRWFWEMDGARNASEAESPAKYIAAWRHIVGIFRDRNVDNAQFVWCPNADAFNRGTDDAEAWYPGDAWVDWLCADGYNWAPGRPGDSWRSLAEIFENFHKWAVPHDKPIMIGETGAQERKAGEKAAWFRQAARDLKTTLREVDILLFFDSQPTVYNWYVDSTASSLAGWVDLVNDPYLSGGTVFADTFVRGVRQWDAAKGAAIDRSAGADSGAPSLKLAGSKKPAFVRETFRRGYASLCVIAQVKVKAVRETTTLFHFMNEPRHPIGRLMLNARGRLVVKSDLSGRTKQVPDVRLARDVWHEIAVCSEKGSSGSWEVVVNGRRELVWNIRNGGRSFRTIRLGQRVRRDYIARFDDIVVWTNG
jgi:hypothetical protein